MPCADCITFAWFTPPCQQFQLFQHGRGQANLVADHDAERFLADAERVFRLEDDIVSAGGLECAGNATVDRIDAEPGGKMSHAELQRPRSRGGNVIEKRRSGPNPENLGAVNGRSRSRRGSEDDSRLEILTFEGKEGKREESENEGSKHEVRVD